MNKVTMIGRLTKNPTVQVKGDDTKVAKFTLAVDRHGKQQDAADFIPVTCFGKVADFCEKYLTKGIKIAVSGKLQSGSYDNKDGQRVFTLDVIASEIEFCEKKAENATSNDGYMDASGSDIPFN